MKKIIYSAMAVAMLATTSCKDDFAESFVGEEATVEFSISTPEIGTRAYSDGSTATVLQYAIYDEAGNELTALTHSVTNENAKEIKGSAKISLQLKNNKSYQMVVWAAAPNAPYAVDFSDKTMKVDYTNVTCNEESRDAFYAYKEFTVNGNKTERIELKRPFAQLNIGASDFEKAGKSGYVPTHSQVTVRNVYSTFNFASGKAGGENEITFKYAELPTDGSFPVTGNDYLAMNYILVGNDQETVEVYVEHKNDKEGDSKTIGSVPLKRNYRTNIYGNLLTSTTDVNVEIVPDFGGEYNNPIAVADAEQLQAAIANPTGDIVLQKDIDLKNTTIVIAPSTRSNTISNIVIDLNGKTVTSTAKKAFEVYTNATFKNGVIEAANRCIDTRTAVNLVLDNVTLIADEYTSYGNPQPLTIGGNDNGTEVTMNNVNISAEAGYGIITFVETNLTATNSNISGYSALYVKPGSDNSEFNFINTTLSGSTVNNDVVGNSFSTIAPRANNVTINVDEASTVEAVGNYCYALSLGSESIDEEREIIGAYVTILGTIEGNILAGGKLNDNTIVVDEQYKEALVNAGYTVEIVNGNAVITNATIVSTADELVAALEDGQNVYLKNDIKIDPASMSNAYGTTGINVKNGQTIDGGGHTLNIQGAGGTWDSGINTTGGIIRNITVTGSFRGIFINHTSTYSEKVVLENVTIGGNGTVYTISCDQGLYQGIEATNCTFNGWTSFAKTAGEAKFVNCSFGEGSGYKYCRPYSNTEFVNCTFCPGYAVDTTRATVTFTDCTWEE